MNELQKAIERIAYENKKFPEDALAVISANREEAIPYLRSAIQTAMEKKQELEDNYQLHFYALCLLGEFQDREFFPKLMEFVSLPGEILDYLIGDLITSGLKDILYNTYNGDIDLLKEKIMTESINEYVRSALLDVMGQLYLDGIVEKEDWKQFIKQNVHGGMEYNYFYDAMAYAICQCHFVDMLPEIRYMLDDGLMDEITLGKYDSCVDFMFEYNEEDFCQSPINVVHMLKHWAMFQEDDEMFDKEERNKKFEELIKQERRKSQTTASNRKIGRNDPCPCGSGKKYKFCCLKKPKSPLDSIESEQERKRCLERYPYIGDERQEDKVYLDDYFDFESIEIDTILYLGLMNRPGLIWERNMQLEENRCREYLSLAFPMFMDKVEKEGIQTFEEYNQKFSIHYFCEDWLGVLLSLLDKKSNRDLYAMVKKAVKNMG